MLFSSAVRRSGRGESYMIPVDARSGRNRRPSPRHQLESVLETIKDKGARARIAVVDASRRNPYESRFRAFSHGLAPITRRTTRSFLSSATRARCRRFRWPNSVLVTADS